MPVQTDPQYTTPADGRQLKGRRRTACRGPAGRLVVVSVDGLASADLPLLADLPHFGRMIREGCRCPELRGVEPTETYPLPLPDALPS